jgi:hypothetical protein
MLVDRRSEDANKSRRIHLISGGLPMRTFAAALLASTLLVSSADAANQSVTPLPPGKPAGSKEAALLGPNAFLLLLGAGILIGGIALAVSNNSGNGGVTTPTTTGTGG